MVALQGKGLGDVAARYAYRAQIMQRKRRFYERNWGAYLGSGFLAILAGYGYRLWRILVAYAVVVAVFAVLYSIPGLARHGLSADLVSTHSLDTAQSWIATAESVVGIVNEGLFVAVLIQRLFSR
jgi:purine-cytosine permease-like protein